MTTIRIKTEARIFILSFLFLPMIILLLFVLYPLFRLFQMSLTNWDGLSEEIFYVGIQNYIDILSKSPDVWLSLKNNFIYFFVHLAVIPLEIFVAFLLDNRIKAAGFFKSVIFMPYIINGVAVAYMFSLLFSPQGGAFNEILSLAGLTPVRWLSDPSIVNLSLSGVSIWRFSGMHVILFLAALQSINVEIMEASLIDGAGLFTQFWHIVIPNILTTVEIVLFLNLRGALQVFDIPFVMTQGGPGHASSTFTLYTIETAFNFNSFGRAASMAVILIVIILLLSQIQNALTAGKERFK